LHVGLHDSRRSEGAVQSTVGIEAEEQQVLISRNRLRIRPGLRPYATASGKTVFVVADAYCANTSAGEGNPVEVMDLSLALQLRALDYLASHDLPVGVHLLPSEIDDEVAASQLAAVGVGIDVSSAEQTQAATTW
jgi:adenosylhomocysteinase